MYNFILGGVQFPVAPPSFELNVNGKNETVTLINEGEINQLKKPGLSDIDFELLLPNNVYPFAIYNNGFQSSDYYLQHFETLMTNTDNNGRIQPTNLIVNRIVGNRLIFDTNLDVSVEGYTILEDAESLGFDVKVVLKLKQYRPYGTKLLKVQTPATTTSNPKVTVENTRSTVGKIIPKTYTVKQGDTLYNIAKKELGDAKKADEIARKNNISNPNLIKIGQVLQLQ